MIDEKVREKLVQMQVNCLNSALDVPKLPIVQATEHIEFVQRVQMVIDDAVKAEPAKLPDLEGLFASMAKAQAASFVPYCGCEPATADEGEFVHQRCEDDMDIIDDLEE